ncbi:MAG: glycosyltransferase [Paludibacteraceae bacterium]|nr:glycosyltransferase [Paludibacteraceae bacterium]
MNKPLVSIVIPVYKAEDYILECAKSLFEQTYLNIEFVFVNDATPDKSIKIIKEVARLYPNRLGSIKYFDHKINQGNAKARNTGLHNCQGEYIIQVDSDDWVEPNYIETLVDAAVRDDADLTCCGYFIEGGGTTTSHFVTKEMMGREGIKSGEFSLGYCVPWNKLVKHSVLIDNNIYCIEGTNNWVDVGIVVPMRFMSKKITIVDKCLYHYNWGTQNSVSKKITDKRINDMVKTAQVLTDFISSRSRGFEYALNYLQFYSKAPMITGTNHQYNRWRATFPESNEYILKYPIDWFHKIMYILSTYHLSFVYELAKKINKH